MASRDKEVRDFEKLREHIDPTFEMAPREDVMMRDLKGATTFIITEVQNATPVHDNFWASLMQCQKHRKAAILAHPGRYKNPTSLWSGSQRNAEWWDKRVRPYLWNQRLELNKNLVFLGDMKTQPTAKDPLMGVEGQTGSESTIVAHTKLQFTTVPTPGHKMAKIMTTTGACTIPNYTDSRIGKHAEFHHTLSAVIVEIEDGYFWLRQLNAHKDGTFIDLDTLYTPDGNFPAPRPEAVVLGDTHVEFTDMTVDKATWVSPKTTA